MNVSYSAIDSLQIVVLQEELAGGRLGDTPAQLLNITSNYGKPERQRRMISGMKYLFCVQMEAQCLSDIRVWKGILGIRDLSKIRCGIRENAKYLDEIQDLTAL